MTMYGALVCLAVPGLAAAALPPMEYRYASFGVPDPAATASFLLRFVNATRITDAPSLWLRADVAPNSTLEALRLPYADGAAYSDVYLELDATLPPSGGVAQFADALEATHTMAQDDWDWWLDTHLAFSVADLDGVAARLLRANVPFVNRGSVYFVAPGGVVVQVLGEPSIYWTEPFLFCRRTADATTGAMRPYALNVTDVGALPAPAALPEFAPSHMSFAATAAKTSAFWAQRVLAFFEVVPAWDTHAWANGTCADIRWMEVASRWEIHFVEQFFKREGARVSVADHERALARAHAAFADAGGASQFDAFRTGFGVADAQPYIDALDAAGEPYRLTTDAATGSRALLLLAPCGQLFELSEAPLPAPHDSAAAARAIRPCRDERHAC